MFLKIICLKTILLFLIIHNTKCDFSKNCPFVYTVDLTGSTLLANSSYLYQNKTIIPPQYVREYNYTILLNNTSKNRTKGFHKRGCICAVTQCLPICSDKIDKFYDEVKSKCDNDCFQKNITYSGGIVKRKHLLKDFHVIYGNVCDIENGYMMSPELEEHNEWTLYEVKYIVKYKCEF